MCFITTLSLMTVAAATVMALFFMGAAVVLRALHGTLGGAEIA